MKSKGIIRRIDELGRIVIPKEMRDDLVLPCGAALEIHREGDTIVMRRDMTSCIFCGSEESVLDYKGKSICRACLEEVRKLG